MDDGEKVTLAPPVIEDRAALRIAGMSHHFTFKTMETIPHLWQTFRALSAELAFDGPPPAYGVTGPMPEGSDGFDYMAAAALPKDKELLPGLTEMTLPAGTYARFRHEGHISKIRATCAAVYETGIPRLGREPDTRMVQLHRVLRARLRALDRARYGRDLGQARQLSFDGHARRD